MSALQGTHAAAGPTSACHDGPPDAGTASPATGDLWLEAQGVQDIGHCRIGHDAPRPDLLHTRLGPLRHRRGDIPVVHRFLLCGLRICWLQGRAEEARNPPDP